MPVIIDRDKSSSTRPAARATKPQAPSTSRRLIYSCIVVIIICWCLVAFQMFGGGLSRTTAGQKPVTLPAGIKLTPGKTP